MKNTAKKFSRVLVTSILLLSMALSLGACSKGEDIVADGSAFKDKRTNVTYVYAPFSYEPIELGAEVYGESEHSKFYEIAGLDPLEFICEESGTVFYSEDTTLPTPDKMKFDYLEICTEDESITVESTVTNIESIKAIMNEHLSAKTLTYWGDTALTVYKLRFADTSLGLYYSVSFIRYAEDRVEDGVNYGKDFIYDSSTFRLTKAPDALVAMIDA